MSQINRKRKTLEKTIDEQKTSSRQTRKFRKNKRRFVFHETMSQLYKNYDIKNNGREFEKYLIKLQKNFLPWYVQHFEN